MCIGGFSMGVKDGIRFCDACGKTVSAGQKLIQSGGAWVCQNCALPVVPPRRVAPAPLLTRSVDAGLATKIESERRKKRFIWQMIGLSWFFVVAPVLGLLGWFHTNIVFEREKSEINERLDKIRRSAPPLFAGHSLKPDGSLDEAKLRSDMDLDEANLKVLSDAETKAQTDIMAASEHALLSVLLPWAIAAIAMAIAGIVAFFWSFR